jgi:hypothetical protein
VGAIMDVCDRNGSGAGNHQCCAVVDDSSNYCGGWPNGDDFRGREHVMQLGQHFGSARYSQRR